MASTIRLLGPDGKPLERRPAPSPRDLRVVRGRYAAAQTNNDNMNHWAAADSLSARGANSPEVRQKLRMRARLECAENNSYAWGIVQTLANHTVGTGPRLQLLTDDEEFDPIIERSFGEWASEIGLAEKLRTMRQARAIDGEAFALMTTNPRLRHPVKLDLRLIEADQVADPFTSLMDPTVSDGIRFDGDGNPVAYYVLRDHPGDGTWPGAGGEYDVVPADLVIHWFRTIRPGQIRGIPDVTPALPLFAQLRRYTLAVIAAAETAADFAAVLYTDMPPDTEDLTDDEIAGETFEINRRVMTTLPAGWKMGQFEANQPTTTYEMFKHEILNEIARCLNMPFNIAAGNSSGYNYSSGRLDHQTYYQSIAIDQHHAGLVILDRLFNAWLIEAKLATRLIPASPDPVNWPRQWLWTEQEHVDPEKEARAQETRLANGMTSFDEECQRQGVDPETRARNIARGIERWKRLGLPPPAYMGGTAPGTSPTAPAMEDSDEEV